MQVAKNSVAFNQDGSLTVDGQRACKLMQIDPKSLRQVTEQDLINEGTEKHIAKVRAEHMLEKRMQKIDMLENTIRSGMLGQLSSVMQAVENRSPQFAKTQALNQSQSYSGSDLACEIPLREPLDPEYRLNRKLAKQIYNKERFQQVQANKEQMVEQAQQQLEAKNKKQKKADKKKEEAKRNEDKDFKRKMGAAQDKRKALKDRVEEEARQNHLEQRETMREMDRKYKEKKDKAAKDYELKKARDYKKDLEYHELLTNKQGLLAKQQQAEEREVVEKVTALVKKGEHGQSIFEQEREKKAKVAQDHNDYQQSVFSTQKQIEYHFDLPSVYKGFERVKESDKRKDKHLKNRAGEVEQRRRDHAEKAAEKLKNIHADKIDMYKQLREKDNLRGKLIDEIKSALKEDTDQKKEISILKKKDQIENYERGKNFHQLYKQKLVERILEKKERAERVKDQQHRLAGMVSTQRVRVNRAFSQTATQIIGGKHNGLLNSSPQKAGAAK